MTNKRGTQPKGSTQEWEGPILAEIHARRERIAAACGYDMDRIFDYFAARGVERRKKETERTARGATVAPR